MDGDGSYKCFRIKLREFRSKTSCNTVANFELEGSDQRKYYSLFDSHSQDKRVFIFREGTAVNTFHMNLLGMTRTSIQTLANIDLEEKFTEKSGRTARGGRKQSMQRV